jgi:hypothetical protein
MIRRFLRSARDAANSAREDLTELYYIAKAEKAALQEQR